MKKDLRIDSFNPCWWAYLALQLVIVWVIAFIFKDQSFEAKRVLLIVIGFISVLYFFFYKYLLWSDPEFQFHWQDELPLQLCNLGTVFSLLGALTNNAFLLGYCCCIAPIGALIAIVMPCKGFTDLPAFSKKSLGFYGHHGLIVVNGLLILLFKMYSPTHSYTIPMTVFVGILLCISYLINAFVRKKWNTEANYMFTYDTDNNPVLEMLYKLIPYRLFYTLPLLPLVTIIHTVLVLLSK